MKYLKILLCGCIVLTLCSCDVYNYFFTDEENGFFRPFAEVSYQKPPKIEVSDYYTAAGDSPVERDLTEMEVEAYNLMCSEIEAYQLSFTLDGFGADEVVHAFDALMDDHPEYFWLKNGYHYTQTTGAFSMSVEFTPTSDGDAETIAEKKQLFDAKVEDILSEAEQAEGLYEKVLFVHDYIVEHTVYDHEAAEYADEDETGMYFDSGTAYGCLVKGKAVCSGYAAAFQYLMNRLGIACGRVTGKALDGGEAHEWNYLTLDDYCYQIDVTWDDVSVTQSDGSTGERKSYDYFLVTTEEMLLTHSIDEDQNVPECRGLAYNYYIYNELYLEEYDFDYAAYIIREHMEEGVISIKFGSAQECRRAYDDLLEEQNIFRILTTGNISYVESKNGLILTVML